MNCINFVVPMNPCKCGYYPDRTQCNCSTGAIRRYRDKVSRPLLDRLDLIAEVPRMNYEEWQSQQKGESSKTIRGRVEAAGQIQQERFAGLDIRFNGQMSGRQVRRFCPLGEEEERFMRDIFQKMRLNPRHYDRILKVARTAADLEGAQRIGVPHLSEAVFYRMMAEKYWGGEEGCG